MSGLMSSLSAGPAIVATLLLGWWLGVVLTTLRTRGGSARHDQVLHDRTAR